MSEVAGIVLAAGQGRRMGQPKALLNRPSGTSYLESACQVLLDAGCSPVVAVLGAQADAAAQVLRIAGLSVPAGSMQRSDAPVSIAINLDWASGMSTSLRAGLEQLQKKPAGDGDGDVDVAVIHLVDLPDVGASVVTRLLREGCPAGGPRWALARASYQGIPGHPVLLGSEHWAGVLESLEGDAGARSYLRIHAPALVDVSDLATGRDIDTPEERLKFEAE